jgi:hypothetical protein
MKGEEYVRKRKRVCTGIHRLLTITNTTTTARSTLSKTRERERKRNKLYN